MVDPVVVHERLYGVLNISCDGRSTNLGCGLRGAYLFKLLVQNLRGCLGAQQSDFDEVQAFRFQLVSGPVAGATPIGRIKFERRVSDGARCFKTKTQQSADFDMV